MPSILAKEDEEVSAAKPIELLFWTLKDNKNYMVGKMGEICDLN